MAMMTAEMIEVETTETVSENKVTEAEKQEALSALRDMFERLDRSPKATEVEADPKARSVSFYREHWGSLMAANRAARAIVLYRNMPRTGTEESDRKYLIRCLQKKGKELKRPPRMVDVEADKTMPGRDTFVYFFVTWERAMRAAGFVKTRVYTARIRLTGRWTHLTDEEVLEILKRKAAELGRTPTMREMNEDESVPSVQEYVRRFGSWKQAVLLAGLKYRPRHMTVRREQEQRAQ